MAKHVAPATYTAGRRLTIGGTVYQPGDAIPAATVKGLKRLSSLLSNRDIIPNVDPQRRNKIGRGRWVPTPTDVSAFFRRGL